VSIDLGMDSDIDFDVTFDVTLGTSDMTAMPSVCCWLVPADESCIQTEKGIQTDLERNGLTN
jgi:hypothetical protein